MPDGQANEVSVGGYEIRLRRTVNHDTESLLP
jgi:hypothetical protein